jgi:uncharacterized protein (TIGR02996 family)
VTTEDDFQRALDARPDDWQTRLVFADWLEERDDPRAEGYRAMGLIGIRPTGDRGGWSWAQVGPPTPSPHHLPNDWFYALHNTGGAGLYPATCPTRRAAEDAAALAFATLPPILKAELLARRAR